MKATIDKNDGDVVSDRTMKIAVVSSLGLPTILLILSCIIGGNPITNLLDEANKAIAAEKQEELVTENPKNWNKGRAIVYRLAANKKITTEKADRLLKYLNTSIIIWNPALRQFTERPSTVKRQELEDETWLDMHKYLAEKPRTN
jgi:hypothetical protein